MAIDRWMDKESVVYACNGISFSLKKEGNCAIGNGMNELKWNKPAIEIQCCMTALIWGIDNSQICRIK